MLFLFNSQIDGEYDFAEGIRPRKVDCIDKNGLQYMHNRSTKETKGNDKELS
jgi:hypothetical protein